VRTPTFLDGVPRETVLARLATAAGKEVETGKFASDESSSALAVNTFGWFIERPELLPQLPGCPRWHTVESVDVEYCARFPWPGGRHPWLDAVVQTPTHLIGIESKRFEPFRDKKRGKLSPAYDRPKWGTRMQPFEALRDALRADSGLFELLDAVQLVKHAFGLVTDARRKAKSPHLHYLFAEPAELAGKPIAEQLRARHREEVERFAAAIDGAEVTFSACSYREWLATWGDAEAVRHAEQLLQAFGP
jgi:hypothetical protein